MDAERTGKRGPHQADTPPRVGNYVTARVGNYVTDNPSNLGKYVTADSYIAAECNFNDHSSNQKRYRTADAPGHESHGNALKDTADRWSASTSKRGEKAKTYKAVLHGLT